MQNVIMMKKILFVSCLSVLMMACQTVQQPIGEQQDAQGCLVSTGSTWSVLKQQCVQTFNVADIRLSETINDTTYSIDVILSEDKQFAEVFAVSLPKNTILQAVKGGYISDDNKTRLMNTANGWKLLKNP